MSHSDPHNKHYLYFRIINVNLSSISNTCLECHSPNFFTLNITIVFWCLYIHVCVLSCVQVFVTPWTVAHKTPLSMEFSTQEYWSGLPFPPPGDLPNPAIEPGSPALPADDLPAELSLILAGECSACFWLSIQVLLQ